MKKNECCSGCGLVEVLGHPLTELRPLGKNGELVCFTCAFSDPETAVKTLKMMSQRISSEDMIDAVSDLIEDPSMIDDLVSTVSTFETKLSSMDRRIAESNRAQVVMSASPHWN